MINTQNDLLNTLSKEAFWFHAFDLNAPFYDNYVKYFRKGIINEIPQILDIHWEAIYYLKRQALAPIIIRLIQIASKYPDSNFIESLSFFFSREEEKTRLLDAFSAVKLNLIKSLMIDIESIASHFLIEDEEIVKGLFIFKSLLSELAKSYRMR
jgi:hypothetical protein